MSAPTVAVCAGHSDQLLDRIAGPLRKPAALIDIATLDIPTGRFLETIRNAIQGIASSGEDVTIRIFIGMPVAGVSAHLDEFLHGLTIPANARFKLVVAQAHFVPFHWNHAKIVAAGDEVFVGGHNQWEADYLLTSPVHDLSMTLRGPAAGSAHRFLNEVWPAACRSKGLSGAAFFDAANRTRTTGCPPFPAVPPATVKSGGVTALAVGDLSNAFASKTKRGDISDLARNIAFSKAFRTIRISQQALAGVDKSNKWPHDTFVALADAVMRGVRIEVIMSNPDAKSAGSGTYSPGVGLQAVADKLLELTLDNPNRGPRTDSDLRAKLCNQVELRLLRFNQNEPTWPPDTPGARAHYPANHAKLWFVDDRMFYIGSDNIYPAPLIEFGYIIEDEDARWDLLKTYWTGAWANSEIPDAPCPFDPGR